MTTTTIHYSTRSFIRTEVTETVGQMKDTIVESVNGMTNSMGDMINDGLTKIPLKEGLESSNHLLEENLENLKNEMMTKAQSIGDETERMADQLIEETEDVIRDAETGIVDVKNSAVETIETMKNDMMDELNMNSSPSHSVDTMKTSAPEPEIERILNGEPEDPTSPEATLNELENLNNNNNEPSAPPPEEPAASDLIVEDPPETIDTPAAMKPAEDEMVVEDIKDE